MKNLFSIETDYSSRVYGLDIFRAVAILLVVMSHGGFIIDPALPGFPWIALIDGVELFFVLSGFLIGTILIKMYEKSGGFDSKQLFSFWKRRWFRTLPNYYLILLVNILLVWSGVINGKIEAFNWKFFLFLQNFHQGFTDFFWESWSLTIEEWFYILTPLAIMLFHRALTRRNRQKWVVLTVVITFLIIPLLYRISISGQQLDAFWIDVEFRKVVLTRLDAIMFGVLFAWIKFYRILPWDKIRWPFFIGGLILMYFSMHIAKPFPTSIFAKTIHFSLVGLGASMLLPLADQIKSFKGSFGKSVTHISLISYSMYLINLGIVAQVIEVNFKPDSVLSSAITYLIYWTVVVLLSTLLYKYFEKPAMDLRERTTKKIKID
jgi:peptidoglycan/LPS O-acetylase OafA/YrhL